MKASLAGDPEAAKALPDPAIVGELQADLGMSIMFITHNLGVVAQMCDEVAVIVRAPAAAEPKLAVTAMELPAARAEGRVLGEGVEAVDELVKVLSEEQKLY